MAVGNFDISYIFNAVDKMSPVIDKIARTLNKFEDSAKNNISKISQVLDTLKTKLQRVGEIGRKGFLRLTLPIGFFARTIIKARAEMEDTEVMFKTMLGSAEKADKLIFKIRDLAAKTPFGEKELFKNSKLLLNFGLSAEEVIPSLTMLGDISGGNVDRFNRLSLAFAQVKSQGRLLGNDMLQMVGAGFNPLQVISEKTGLSMGKLKDIMAKGGISFEHVRKSMKLATSEGGKFFNLMEERSKTASGRFSTFIDNMRKEFVELGKILEPITKLIIEKLIVLTEKFSKLSPKTKKIILGITFLLGLLPILAIAISSLAIVITGFTAGITFLITAFSVLSGAIIFFTTPAGLLIASATAVWYVFKNWKEVLYTLDKVIRNFGSLIGNFFNERIKIFLENITKVGKVLSSIKDKILSVIKLTGKDIDIDATANVKLNKEKFDPSKNIETMKFFGANKSQTDVNVLFGNVPQGTKTEVNSKGDNVNTGVNMSFAGGL